MQSEREREDAARLAVHVEPVAVGETAVVAIGGGQDADEHASRGNDLPLELDVFQGEAGHLRPGRFVAEDLLDGIRDERRVLDQVAALVGMIGEDLGRPANELGGGLVPRTRQQRDEREDLLAVRRRVVPVSSTNSTLRSSVIRSSDGWSARQSMYSANMSSANCDTSTSRGRPGSLRVPSLTRSCTAAGRSRECRAACR